MLKNHHLPRPLTLPSDIILDILSRLPGKSIKRFGCVSRNWHASLSDPSFRSLHGDISRKKPLFIKFTNFAREGRYDGGGDCYCPTCMSDEEEEEDIPQNHEPPPPTVSLKTEDKTGLLLGEYHLFNLDGGGKVSVIPSGRELICLLTSDSALYVSNPTTHELLKLPKPAISFLSYGSYFSLCYVPSLGHFRLIHVYLTFYDEFDPVVTASQVLDIKPGEKPTRWRVSCESFPMVFRSKLMNSVQNVDAAAFWYTQPDPILKFDNVFCYDFEKDVCLKIEKPHGCSDSFGPFTSLVGLNGCLSLIDVVQDRATMTMDIWLLKDFRNSVWQKEYTLDTSSAGIYRILPVHFGEREIIFDTYSTTGGSRMRFYDMVTKTWCTGGRLNRSFSLL